MQEFGKSGNFSAAVGLCYANQISRLVLTSRGLYFKR